MLQKPYYQELMDMLAMDTFGMTQVDAQESGICIDCKEPAVDKCHSELDLREYSISGMCGECYTLNMETSDED